MFDQSLMDAQKLKLIYFDVGGVLMHFYHIRDQVAASLGIDSAELGTFLNGLEISRSNGSMSEVEVEAKIRERFALKFAPGFWSNLDWVNNFRPIHPMHEFVKSLVGKYRIGVLSNVSQEIFTKGRSIPGLWPDVQFDPMILSFAVKLAKPDPEIFRHAVKVAGCEPAEILFIDDVEANFAAAQSVGLQVFLFNPAEAERDVVQLRKILLPNKTD